MAEGSGAPCGERNGSSRHGLYTREAIAERRALRALMQCFRQDARDALSELDATSGTKPSRVRSWRSTPAPAVSHGGRELFRGLVLKETEDDGGGSYPGWCSWERGRAEFVRLRWAGRPRSTPDDA
jgi:hypothetical protein